MKYGLRKATWDDFEYLDKLVTDNMKGHVNKVSPWNARLFRDNFKPETIDVIEVENKAIGFTKLVHNFDELYLAEIQIDRVYQNQGIGTLIINAAIAASEKLAKKITLNVIKGNPAEYLYKRLGFEDFDETETHRKLQRLPMK